jgi:hypothetical protein
MEGNMNEEAIRAEMRLYVLEVFFTNLLVVNCITANPQDPMKVVTRLSDQMLAGARVKGFPEVDPAMSDLLSAELESAVSRLANMASEQIRFVLKNREGR